MEIFVLASGSKGNIAAIKINEKILLIDCGIPLSKIKEKLNSYNLNMSDLETLFLTHEHSDHISGLKALLKEKTIKKVVLSKGTYDSLDSDAKKVMPEVVFVDCDMAEREIDYSYETIFLSHDAKEPIGFIIYAHDKKAVFLTDTGYVPESEIDKIRNAQFYLLEANHCPKMLISSKRPSYLKQRILNEKGHLSNEDAAIIMNEVVDKKSKAVWVVGHISEECNSISKIEKAIVSYFDDTNKIEVYYSGQDSLEVIKI